MIPERQPLLADARQYLQRELAAMRGQSDVLEALAVWAVPELSTKVGLQLDTAAAARRLRGSGRTYREVAVLGFAIGANPRDIEAWRADFSEGVKWLVGRPVFSSALEPAQFCHDAIALLGIFVGVIGASDEQLRQVSVEWLRTFLPRMVELYKAPSSSNTIFYLLERAVASSVGPRNMTQLEPDVMIALDAANLFARSAEGQELSVDTVEAALGLIKRADDVEPERVVFMLSALDVLMQQAVVVDIARPTIKQVGQLLERLPVGLRRWTWENAPKTSRTSAQQWDVQHEYHVQNLLYALLAPLFPDITDEETLAPIGQKNARVDLGIPSLGLIIEVKFLRQSDSFAKLIGELAEDASLYLAHGQSSRYRNVLPFVWDDSRRTEEHHKFLDGMCQIKGIVHPVIIPRPGGMVASKNPA